MAGLMTEREKMAVTLKSIALSKAGREAEAMALEKSIPMPPFWPRFGKSTAV
ncbi:MAG: hypothetical protein LBR16_03270 [Treponema sp.]|jgi:hypothetical protein|nr:hypothetical protein [Treponema sp.]